VIEEYDIHDDDESGSNKELEQVLRPKLFDDFAGQRHVTDNLQVFVKAAILRNEPLDHVLLHGPPGLGKTTLAHIIANEMNVGFKVTSGPVLDKPGDLAGLLTNLEEGDVLFIDEIHRLSPVIEEYLYSAMEDYKIDILIDSGPNARTVQIELSPFTLIGATTRSGMLTAPLRARFGISSRLQYYETKILTDIVERSSGILAIPIDYEAAFEISGRSRGTPRIANALLRRVRDFAQIQGDGTINTTITATALEALHVDKHGLDEMDNRILSVMIEKFGGGPVGLTTIATAVGEQAGTIEEVYEPFLIQEGYIARTPRGRMVTELAYKHLTMKKLFVFVLFVSLVNLNFASNIDSINGDSNVALQEGITTSEIEITPEGSLNKLEVDKEQYQELDKSLQEQAEEIPVVFGQWWFWVGLFAIVLFLKLVIFKK